MYEFSKCIFSATLIAMAHILQKKDDYKDPT